MRFATRWARGALSADVELSASGVLTVRFSGVETIAAVRRFVADMPALLDGRAISVFVFDHLMAQVRVGLSEWNSLVAKVPADQPIAQVCICLCRVADRFVFDAHAAYCGARGAPRIVLTEAGVAASLAEALAVQAGAVAHRRSAPSVPRTFADSVDTPVPAA